MDVTHIVSPDRLRDAIADALADKVKAYNLAAVCVRLGMAAQGQDENPFYSKRVYVHNRLLELTLNDLAAIAGKVVEEYDVEELRTLLAQLGAHGVKGNLKNLIFAADGPKPRIVLRDAINNVIEIVENAQHCLVYDRPLSERGLTWRELVSWWAALNSLAPGTEHENAQSLYVRLRRSLANDAERLMFKTYCTRYAAKDGLELPALIPQVYLHYDPYTIREISNRPRMLKRQRMDFLLLLPRHDRVVIEIDGIQHYAKDGVADPTRYAEMVSEDRSLRLAGYEVYRFGGRELADEESAGAMLNAFFDALLERHKIR